MTDQTTDSKRSINATQEKSRENHTEAHHGKSSENQTHKVFTASRERRQITCEGTTRLTEARRQQSIFLTLKERNRQARILYTGNIPTKNKGEVRASREIKIK